MLESMKQLHRMWEVIAPIVGSLLSRMVSCMGGSVFVKVPPKSAVFL